MHKPSTRWRSNMEREMPFGKNDKPVLLFDGVCRLCTGAVSFIIKRDPRARLLFASLQSAAGQQLLAQFRLERAVFSTLVLIDGPRCYTKSTAVLRVCKYLSGLWPLLYGLILIPRPLRDLVYDWIARNRHAWFGRQDACPVPTEEVKGRFLE